MIEPDWIPDVILLPKNKKQISRILKIAHDNKIPVIPRGNGTSLSVASMAPYGGIILDLSGMNKINSVDIENFLVDVEPGVICDDLNAILKDKGFFFPPDPGSSSVATIGGMVSHNSAGIQSFKYGTTKNYVLYLECVLPGGKIVTFGNSVLKSASSYNFKDLIIGSEGTLAVVTRIGLKILPLPKEHKVGLFIFEKIEDLTGAVLDLRRKGVIPNMMEFLDHTLVKLIFEHVGGEFLDYPVGYALLVEVDGKTDFEVNEEILMVLEIFNSHSLIFSKIASTKKDRDRLIGARKALLPAISKLGPTVCAEDCTIQVTKFTSAVKLFEELPEKLGISNIKVAMAGHMEGNIHPVFIFNENDPKDREDFEKALDYLYKEIVIPLGGSITGEHGIGKIKSPYLGLEHGSDVVDLMYQVKKIFDPNMIMNPGSGKGDPILVSSSSRTRKLKRFPRNILELNCMRCGFCLVNCPSKAYFKTEAYSPRGRLSILNAMVHGEIPPEKYESINKILYACTLCGQCLVKCPSGVQTQEIFERAREILHKD
ncbi:MAG: FAD-binding and (Fe-S)-binding domain-containing protein [Candidatus Hodarchaeota archaeon]